MYASATATARVIHGVEFPVNEYGLTYGSIGDVSLASCHTDAEFLSYYPDLIMALASNGAVGYVRSEELLDHTRGNASPPVYEKDGQTVIGYMNGE